LYVSPSIDQVHETGHLKCFLIVFCMSSASSTEWNQIENTLPLSPCRCAEYKNFISLSIGIFVSWLDHQTSGATLLITHLRNAFHYLSMDSNTILRALLVLAGCGHGILC